MQKICRINPVMETLRASPKRVNRIMVQQKISNQKIKKILTLARERHISLQFVPKKYLDRIDRQHQGLVAFIAPKGFSSIDAILEEAKIPFLVLLDNIQDPQNLGAIIRTAEGAGVNGVIIPQRRAAGLTNAVSSVSAGALEYLKVAQVTNLARTINDLKKQGIWMIGAESSSTKSWYEFDYSGPVGLILGSEGKGLRPLVKNQCDEILSLPLPGNISSLNVSAAAAVFIYEVVRQRRQLS